MKRISSVTTASTDFPAFTRERFEAQVEAPVSGGNKAICHLLGYSLQSTDGRRGAAPSKRHLDIPQSTLRGLLRRYPNGHVFLFNSDGSLLDDEETEMITHGNRTNRERSASKGKSIFEKEKEQLRAYQLLDICPGARGIIFFPLWDPQRDQVSVSVLEHTIYRAVNPHETFLRPLSIIGGGFRNGTLCAN